MQDISANTPKNETGERKDDLIVSFNAEQGGKKYNAVVVWKKEDLSCSTLRPAFQQMADSLIRTLIEKQIVSK